jgi:predicted nuclease with TOPRIM domain
VPADLEALEQLVARAADQLRRLRAERARLLSEIGRLEDERATVERERAELPGPEVWQAERAAIAAVVRETLDELRGE